MKWTAVFTAAVLTLALCGCTRASAPASTTPASAQKQVIAADSPDLLADGPATRDLVGLVGQLGSFATVPEPKRGVTRGVYLGRITSISGTDSAPVFTVDFITEAPQPGTPESSLHGSSWPDFIGWNRYVHPQRFKVDDAGQFFDNGLQFQDETLEGFVQNWRSDSDASRLNRNIFIDQGEVHAVWPWMY